MQLFSLDAPWRNTASRIQVFKLYGEWVAYHATDEELRQAVEGIQKKGLAIAVEVGPNPPPESCGQNVESFAGIPEGLQIAQRIKQAGGKIDIIAMDEPYYYGHFYDDMNACKWTDQKIAQQIGEYIDAMRDIFPNLIVGDTEPLTGLAGASEYQAWLVTFKAVNKFDLAFIHMDIDWSRPDWPKEMLSLQEFGHDRGIPVGIIYTGNSLDENDQSWISISGERIKRYELENGGHPDHILFQSWNDKPDHTLPEKNPYTFTGLINTYFENKSALGFPKAGRGTNLAYKKTTRFSSALPGYLGNLAVDGDIGTWWSAGKGPPQWIDVDLGDSFNIMSIRLVISQFPAGMTVHKIWGRGSGTSDGYVLLHSFAGVTNDTVTLSFKPETPWQGIRDIRIETLQTPSWVAWREIEVIDAGGE
jgi:hypothetical protein